MSGLIHKLDIFYYKNQFFTQIEDEGVAFIGYVGCLGPESFQTYVTPLVNQHQARNSEHYACKTLKVLPFEIDIQVRPIP